MLTMQHMCNTALEALALDGVALWRLETGLRNRSSPEDFLNNERIRKKYELSTKKYEKNVTHIEKISLTV
jgi:hypothetical protein